MWTVVAVVCLVSAVAVRFARRVALKKALLDHPNERSSHKQPVPRLGGAAFMPVVLLAVGVLAPRAGVPTAVLVAFLGGAIALFAVSLADDFITLSTGVRFAVQFAAAGALLWAVVHASSIDTYNVVGALFSPAPPLSVPPSSDPSPLSLSLSPSSVSSSSRVLPALSLFLLTLWLVGTVNIYNFMDGIDGIAGVQAVLAGVAWAIFGFLFHAPFVASVGALVAAGALGFLTLNWPPAKIFMGDAGSTVLGYIFAAMPLLLVGEGRQSVSFPGALIAAVLVVWPFLCDGAFTILRRLKNRENILKAHRSHLYQRLVIAGKRHQQVTLVYGALAAGGAVLAWRVLVGSPGAVLMALIGVSVLFLALWVWTVRTEGGLGTNLENGKK
jgi:UDP-N-acetylmuramyl pentapeptide phosphotransferase/UDP-N-acetylglucosamine-1-phosphate transferase